VVGQRLPPREKGSLPSWPYRDSGWCRFSGDTIRHDSVVARTIARMPARTGGVSIAQASTMAARSASANLVQPSGDAAVTVKVVVCCD